MAMSTWMVLGVICLLYVAFGIWAVSQIFPRTPATTPRSDLDQNAPIVGQDAPTPARSTKTRTLP